VIAAAAVAVAGSGLALWLKPPSLADSGEAPGGQISVAGATEAREEEEKGWFLFAGERPPFPVCFLLMRYLSLSLSPCLLRDLLVTAAAVV
jgi:hypothetical protein